MGAGATAGVQSVIDETHMDKALGELSVDDKVKFWMTVSESGAQPAIDGSVVMKEEFGKLSEENQGKLRDLITQASKDPKPLLVLASEKGKAWVLEQCSGMTAEQQAAMSASPEAKTEWNKKYRAYVMEELKPIYAIAFAHHDADKSGVLNKEQALVLFDNVTELAKDAIAWSMQNYAEPIGLMLLGEGEHSDDDKKAKTEKVIAAIEPAMAAIMKTYNEDKESKNSAAFEALDGGSGGIPLDTFLELFIDESEVQKKYAAAVGMGEEAIMTKIGEAAA